MKSDGFLEQPTAVFVVLDDGGMPEGLSATNGTWSSRDVTVVVKKVGTALSVGVNCPRRAIGRVGLRWKFGVPAGAILLGDHWERGYGDLQWRGLQAERVLPWYFAAHTPADGATMAVGVKTQAGSICSWLVDGKGVTLWMDLHNGGMFPDMPGTKGKVRSRAAGRRA